MSMFHTAFPGCHQWWECRFKSWSGLISYIFRLSNMAFSRIFIGRFLQILLFLLLFHQWKVSLSASEIAIELKWNVMSVELSRQIAELSFDITWLSMFCIWLALNVLLMSFTLLHMSHTGIFAGDSSWHNEETVQFLNCAFQCHHYHHHCRYCCCCCQHHC